MAQATFGTLKGLSARKENELCVSIAGAGFLVAFVLR